MTSRNARIKRGLIGVATGAVLLPFAVVALASPAQAYPYDASVPVDVLDQSSSGTGMWLMNFSAADNLYQTFTSGVTGALSRVDLRLGKDGSPVSIVVGIRAVSAGNPTGSDLTYEILPGSSIPAVNQGSNAIVRFTNPVNVQAGTQYAITLHDCTGCSQYSNGIAWQENYNAGYSGGNAVTWGTNAPGRDLVFATYILGSATETRYWPDEVLQQVGRPVSGSCADVDDSNLNLGGVSSGGWTPSWAQWANNGSGGDICGRTLYYAPSGSWEVRR